MRGATAQEIETAEQMRFQPTLPVRGATPGGRCWSDVSPFQPTLPVRGATAWAPTTTRRSLISTHAPRAGSDRPPAGWSPSGSYFNPRSPCGERQAAHAAGKWPDGFQPTLPVRGATSRPYNSTRRYLYFNPRSPCGERLCRPRKAPSCVDFNPRSPCGERPEYGISAYPSISYFNPRSPCGERRAPGARCRQRCQFQPTLPVRGATAGIIAHLPSPLFQPTLPVRGAT